MRPVILVSCTRLVWPEPTKQYFITYVQAMERAGASCLLLPNSTNPENASAAAEVAEGLLLSGGGDVDPSSYEQEPHPKTANIDKSRDISELAAIETAMRRGIPILAICRGIQVLNVAMGGSLIQDIPDWSSRLPEADRLGHSGTEHEIEIQRGTLTESLWGTRINVNSRHHQALAEVSRKLKVTARSSDGIVEAAESAEGYPLLALQCHPEDMWQADKRYLKPFEWLCSEAVSRRRRS